MVEKNFSRNIFFKLKTIIDIIWKQRKLMQPKTRLRSDQNTFSATLNLTEKNVLITNLLHLTSKLQTNAGFD